MKLKYERYKINDRVIKLVFICLVYIGLCIFFMRFNPIEILDTDDWTYLCFARGSKLLPKMSEWNPIKILPENLMPISGFLGKTIRMSYTGNLYESVTWGMNVVLALFVSFIIVTAARVITSIFHISVFEEILVGMFLLLVCFVPYKYGQGPYNHFFSSENATCVFNYTIPTIFNAILVFVTIIHEKELEQITNGRYLINKIIYLILIYFAIFSNLYCSIVLASYAIVKMMLCVLAKKRECSINVKNRVMSCLVYSYILVLWFVSMIFEINGGRAESMQDRNFELSASFCEFFVTLAYKNIFFNILLVSSILFYLIMLIKILHKRRVNLRQTITNQEYISKDLDEGTMFDPNDVYIYKYINWSSCFFLCSIITELYLILLSAKTGAGYFDKPAVQLDYYSFLLLNMIMVIGYVTKRNRKILYGIFFTVIVLCAIILSKGPYREYNMRGLSNDKCKAITDFIIQQYTEADRSGDEHIQIIVPDFESDDNFPIATYGNTIISRALYNYGIVTKYIETELVPDKRVNEIFGL